MAAGVASLAALARETLLDLADIGLVLQRGEVIGEVGQFVVIDGAS